ncbi:tetratricopeptide repeat protein [Geothermobacter ehrlichii]|uniref:Tetratricopeptide repeat protein n=1 Tax=Geothermobacter ehrlichii TaxID=213224 RepID=A0A5D3WPG5_9BACT|nr:tetratricopeptide repeat protein [Geothermobacter ehrlichii]TYP00097.1 tetratricopeptide repeat protein [Geothermobacter ehrlichii]
MTKAIRDYQKIVEIDPKDIRNRQKLAELLSRAKLTEEALQEYEAVAKYYAENGFYLKAIAVYKQMQRLDPAQVRIYYRLAELNEKQGLIGNALAEYKSLVSYYEQNQMPSEAINVLQKMKDLEPENLNVLVKIAEAYARTGMKDKSREEFLEVVSRLREKGEYPKILKLCELLLPFFPEDPEALAARAEALIRTGDHAGAIEILQRVTAGSPELPYFKLLAEGYRQAQDYDREGEVWQRVLELDPEDLEHRLARIRACIDGGRYEAALDELEEWKDNFVQADMTGQVKSCYERLHEVLPEDERIARTLRAIYEMTGEGDKLFELMADSEQTEGSATFGADLEILEDEPVDEALADLEELAADELEEIGESAGVDAGGGADDEPAESPESDETSGEAGLQTSEGEGSVPDGDAAGERIADAEPAGEADEVPLEFLEEVAEEEPEEAESAAAESFSLDDLAADGEEIELELELELELDLDDEPEAVASPPMADAAENADAGLQSATGADEDAEALVEAGVGEEEGGDVAEIAGEQSFADETVRSEPAVEGEPELVVEPDEEFDPAAMLEEAAFYLQQKLFDEAEKLCRSILETDPENAAARARLDEIGAARRAAEEPEAAAESEPEESFDWDDALKEILGDSIGTIDAEDAESHYNLGIAYKEMGLMDDAIKEFDTAMGHPSRRLSSLALKALCLVEKGDYPAAEQTLSFGLACPDLNREERLNLLFEMGQLKEQVGSYEEALDWFLKVADEDHFYRDVGIKIRGLRQRLGLPDKGLEENAGVGRRGKVTYL